ncbi:hypothetical protein HNY73_002992 [Argiope bruennichi]|uniref:Uncharacterized protein n=1 Tax=Argiope bruennichi TaxID=94029 RepID=A0A8T0FVH2_ARGBR|nr:hypothetical protein HNY73_002992 [Argiope bruennichi]
MPPLTSGCAKIRQGDLTIDRQKERKMSRFRWYKNYGFGKFMRNAETPYASEMTFEFQMAFSLQLTVSFLYAHISR